MYIYDKDQFPKLSGIYRIINIVNNKCYIGSAVNLKLRLQKHYYELNKKVHNNKHLLRSYEKYGENNFKIEILEIFENINYNELLNLEKEYIKFFNSIELGYNQILDNSNHFKNLNKTKEHIENNQSVRKSLLNRGIKLENLPPEEDIKKVERRLKSEDKKKLKDGIE